MRIEDPIVRKHQEMVTELAKPGADVLASLTPERYRAWVRVAQSVVHMERSLSEAKKHAIYEAELPDYLKPLADEGGSTITLDEATAQKVDLFHAATGIATEALELLADIVDYVRTGKLDFDNFVKEMGDLEFYMEQARQNQQVGRNETLRVNYDKLRKRYPEGYSNEAAIERADTK